MTEKAGTQISTNRLRYVNKPNQPIYLMHLVDDTPYLMYLNIYMVLARGVATVWSECEHGARRSESSVSGVSFPVPTLSIRAACEADFWHLSVHPSDLSVS